MPPTENTSETKKNSVIPGRNSTLDERLRFILQEENITASTLHKELSEKYQIKRAYETVLGWLKKREDNTEPLIYLSDIKAIAKILRINTLWLATGEGPHRELFDFLKKAGYELPEEKKIQTKEELKQHLLCIHYDNVPVYVSDFDPFIHSDTVFLSPDTELTTFIMARYGKNLAENSGYHNLLINALNTSNPGLFPDWMISRLSPKGADFLRMYYVRDNSMSPILNESNLAVVNTDFDHLDIRKYLKTNHLYAFVSVFGYVFFRRVQMNYNGTAVNLLSENCKEETVPLSEITTMPNSATLLRDAHFFSYLELPPVVKNNLKPSDELARMYEKLLQNEEYQGYQKLDLYKRNQGKKNLELQDIPRYQKLFLIGEVVYRRESLGVVGDPAYSSFAAIFNNFRTIDNCCTTVIG